MFSNGHPKPCNFWSKIYTALLQIRVHELKFEVNDGLTTIAKPYSIVIFDWRSSPKKFLVNFKALK